MNPSLTHIAILVTIVLLLGAGVVVVRKRAAAAASSQAEPAMSARKKGVISLLAFIAVATTAVDMLQLHKPQARDVAADYARGRTFPIRVDDHLQLDAVEGEGQMLTFNYTVNSPGSEAGDIVALLQGQRGRRVAAACGNVDTRKLLESGIDVNLAYHFMSLPVGNVVITKESCEA